MQHLLNWLQVTTLVLLLAISGALILIDVYPDILPEVYAEGPVPLPRAVGISRGDTFWSIAKEFYPDRHTGEMVHKIRQLNPGVDPGRLQVGQMIVLWEVE